MFESVIDKGTLRFKPFDEEKLKSRLSKEEIELLGDYDDFKISVLVAINAIDSTKVYCRCGNALSYKTIKRLINDGGERFCSKSCKTKYTSDQKWSDVYKKYGGKEGYKRYVREKQKQNAIKKYGKPFQATKWYRDKVKKTLQERYGVEHNSSLESVRSKRLVEEDGKLIDVLQSKTSIDKRNETYSNKTSEELSAIAEKIQRTRINNSDIDYDTLFNLERRINHVELAETTNCSKMTAWRYLTKSGLMNIRYTENEISDFINELGFETETTRRVIKPYELDIYIKDKNLAIEYDGIYWHSSGRKEDDKRFKNYHLKKTEMCEERGIQLLHIFENEWVCPVKREIWKSIIRHKLGLSKRIYARNCVKRNIDHKTAKEFVDKNHLQGSCIGGNEYIGLYHNDELVQVAIFGKSRYVKNKTELLRMCSLINHIIVGGASKLCKGKSFISYGNRRWCSKISNVYQSIGEFVKTSDPCYWYIVGNHNLYHRSAYQKHKLNKKLNNYDPSLSEADNCYNNGLRRIWDCGNLIYEV